MIEYSDNLKAKRVFVQYGIYGFVEACLNVCYDNFV